MSISLSLLLLLLLLSVSVAVDAEGTEHEEVGWLLLVERFSTTVQLTAKQIENASNGYGVDACHVGRTDPLSCACRPDA